MALSCALSTCFAASPVQFVPTGDSNAGSVKAELPLRALGKLPVINGSANISGRVITVKSSSEMGEAPHTVLAGSVLRTEANLSSNPPSITGLALFLMGDWASMLDDGSEADTIFCKNGQLSGRIIGLENDGLSVKLSSGKDEKIPLASVLYLRSARVYVFKVTLKPKETLEKDSEFLADAIEASFRPTLNARNLSGSVISQEQKTESEFGMMAPIKPPPAALRSVMPANTLPGLGGSNSMGVSNFNTLNGMGAVNNAASRLDDPRDNSFDRGADSDRFSTVKTKWGTQKLTVPPGMLD